MEIFVEFRGDFRGDFRRFCRFSYLGDFGVQRLVFGVNVDVDVDADVGAHIDVDVDASFFGDRWGVRLVVIPTTS